MNYSFIQTLISKEFHIIFCSTCDFFLHASSLKIDDGTTSISSPATSGYTERFGESKIHILSLSSVCIWGIETLICIYLEIKKDTKWV